MTRHRAFRFEKVGIHCGDRDKQKATTDFVDEDDRISYVALRSLRFAAQAFGKIGMEFVFTFPTPEEAVTKLDFPEILVMIDGQLLVTGSCNRI
jgi:hypothetical protein